MAAPSTVGRHYRGELGERYFEYRSRGADLIAAANLGRFRPFVSADDAVLARGISWLHRRSFESVAYQQLAIEQRS